MHLPNRRYMRLRFKQWGVGWSSNEQNAKACYPGVERPRCIWWLVWVYLCRSSIRKSIESRNFASLSVSFGRGSVAELVLNLFPRLNAVLIAVIECWVRCWIPYLSRNQSERFRLADTCESLIEEYSLTIMFWLDVWAACWLKRTQSGTILRSFF